MAQQSPNKTNKRGNNDNTANTVAPWVNFTQNFSSVQHPTASLLHRQPGRSVRHNLHRMTSPEPTHDFRTSILLGGNHPQNQFRHMLTSKSKLQAEKLQAEAAERERLRQADSLDLGGTLRSLGGFSAVPSVVDLGGGGGKLNGGTSSSRPGSSASAPWNGPGDLETYFAAGSSGGGQAEDNRRKSLIAGMQKMAVASQRSNSSNGGSRPGTTDSLLDQLSGGEGGRGNTMLVAPPRASSSIQQQGRSQTSQATQRPPLGQQRSGGSVGANNNTTIGSGSGAQGVRSLQSRGQQAATAPGGQPRAMTPGPLGGGRAVTAGNSGGSPPKSSADLSGYLQTKPPTDYVKKNIDVAFQRPMTQQATKTAMSRFEEKWKTKRTSDGTEFGDFSLQINGDYETPFATQLPDIEKPGYTNKELTKFERRRKGPRTLTTMPAATFAPPKVIVMMFRFSNVRNLRVTKSLRKVGYPELHEQFSTTSKNGTISKVQFSQVCAKYLCAADRLDCLQILDCFDRNQLGDVDLNMLLIGLQILLECASPGDAMRFCFTLMDTANKIPRYITRYEVQTLVSYASAFAQDAEHMDADYLMMATAIEELLLSTKDPPPPVASAPITRLNANTGNNSANHADSGSNSPFSSAVLPSASSIRDQQRYDYMGRMPLKEFLEALDEKMTLKRADAKKNDKKKQAAQLRLDRLNRGSHVLEKVEAGAEAAATDDGEDSDKKKSQFMFGKAWNQGGAVTAVHRMSSKKMIIQTLMAEHQPL